MKTNLLLTALIFCAFTMQANAASMFDESGNYSGNWKQMTNVSSGKSTSSYSSSSYSSSAWYANNKKERVSKDTSYSAQSLSLIHIWLFVLHLLLPVPAFQFLIDQGSKQSNLLYWK